jgi:hypothetical protein
MENQEQKAVSVGPQVPQCKSAGNAPVNRYTFLWRSQGLGAGAKTIDDMIGSLDAAADALRLLKAAGVVLDTGASTGDDALFVTTDPAVAQRLGLNRRRRSRMVPRQQIARSNTVVRRW